jgi:hypothetical protein
MSSGVVQFCICAQSKRRVTQEECNRCKTAVADSPKSKPKSIAQKIVKYSTAIAKWMAAGMPTREESEVNFIYDTHCAGCAVLDSCPLCGCKVNKSKIAFLNKIKMETEHCPEGKW